MTVAAPFKISAKEESAVALVAGGAGFLGAGLCRYLLEKKIKVICLDNFQTGKRQNRSDFLDRKNFVLLEHDLANPLPKIEPLDYIFHLAGLEEYLDGKDLTLEILRVNSLGTQNLLELARQNRAKFLFASSCEVFSQFPLATKIAQGLTEQQKSFSHHEAKRFSESLIAQYYQGYNLNCRIVRLMDIYGPGMNLEAETTLTKLIKVAQKGEPFILEGEGLEILYPTFIDDAIEGIARATFLSGTSGKIYNLLGERTTALKLAQILNELTGKEAEIEFKKFQEGEPKLLLPPDIKKTQEELGWRPQVSLEEGLKKTLGFQPQERPVPEEAPPVKAPEKEALADRELLEEESYGFLFSRLLKFLLASFLLLTAVFFPFLSISWDVFWGQKNLSLLIGEKSFKMSLAQTKAQAAQSHFLAAQTKLADLSWLFGLLRQGEKEKEWAQDLQAAEEIAAGIEELAKAGQVLEKLGGDILESGQVRQEDIGQVKINLVAGLEKWGKAQALLKENPEEKEKLWLDKLAYYQDLIKVGQEGLEILPQFIALDGRRTYLVLLQNNMEIRPGGGFIGSFGLLSFEKGQPADLKIEDVYAADGQLRGHVEPPEAIKKFLGKEHWFLRDVNWNPDFPQTAQRAQWFLEKEINIQTDGVLAFDLNLVQNFLEVLGPLEIADYEEGVDSQNLFEKTQKYAQTDFFPGSTQKRDFLGALAKSLLEKIKSEKGNWLSLGRAASQAFNERHLAVYLNEPTSEQKILQNGWGGQIKPLPCQKTPACLGDYLMIVEANLGVNKVNFWVKKEIDEKIVFSSDGSVSHHLSLNFQNQSSSESWAGGIYKNYLRIYTPPGTVLDELKIGGIATESAETTTSSADLAKNSGKNVWGFYFEIQPQEKKEVTMSYHLPQKFSGQSQTYQLLFQKQAGSQTDPLKIEILYPREWEIKDSGSLSLTKDGSLEYNGKLEADKELQISFE